MSVGQLKTMSWQLTDSGSLLIVRGILMTWRLGNPSIQDVEYDVGSIFAILEPMIAPTVADMVRLAPSVLVPAHCTGSSAQVALSRALPDAFIPNSVGTSSPFDFTLRLASHCSLNSVRVTVFTRKIGVGLSFWLSWRLYKNLFE